VASNWDTWKRQEKPARTSVLDGVPRGLPALQRAQKLLGRADDVGFAPALPAVAVPADETALGAQLLALVAGARANGMQAERALRSALAELERGIRHAEKNEGSAPEAPDPA